jgi:hypothetical protein
VLDPDGRPAAAREDDPLPVCELAARHGASVAEATDDPVEAYAKAGWGEQTPAELPWPPV